MDMEILINLIVALVSGLLTGATVYFTLRERVRILEIKIDSVEERVYKSIDTIDNIEKEVHKTAIILVELRMMQQQLFNIIKDFRK